MYQITQNYLDDIGHQIVLEEIDNALALYPESLAQKVNFRDFRQKVITDVTNKILLNRLFDQSKKSWRKCKFPYRSLELRLLIEQYAHEVIQSRFQSECKAFTGVQFVTR